MSPISTLPPDQRAVLALVLEKGKNYDAIATLLRIDAQAVRERAHAALDGLGPRDGTPPPEQRRAELSDYLLGQQTPEEAEKTRAYLENSGAGRAWARVVAAELGAIASGRELPAIPSDSGRPSTPLLEMEQVAAPPSPPPSPKHASRRGGAMLLAGAGVVGVAVALILLLSGGGGGSHPKPAASAPASTTSTTATGPVQTVGQINLVPPTKTSHALGVALIVKQGSQLALTLNAQGLAPTSSRLAYAVWLYNSHASAERIGFAPPVKTDGKLAAVAPSPTDLNKFRALIITRETNAQATRPGPIVLAGPIPAGVH